MELGAIMELNGGRGKSTGKKGTPYIVRDKDPTVIHLPARGQRYYRKAARYYRLLPSGTTATPVTARSDLTRRS